MTTATDFLAHDYDVLVHFTPTDKQRKMFAKQGLAMPDGSFYIRNGTDLDNAIRAVGRATPNASESETARRNSVRRHIMKRARELKMTSKIPDTWNSDGSLKQSDIDQLMAEVDEFLAHFGVKGMHWGVRRSRPSGSSGSSGAAKPSRSDVKFTKAATKHSTAQTLHRTAMLNMMMQDLPAINAKPQYAEHKLLSDPAAQKRYDKEVQTAYLKQLRAAANRQRSKSGDKFYDIEEHSGGDEWKVIVRDVKHADETFTVKVKRDPKTGFIIGLELVSDIISQAEMVDEFLAHFGVKGMHWGVRRNRMQLGTHHIVRRTHAAPIKKGSKPSAHPVSTDAQRAFTYQSTVKVHGTSALSNQELQHLVNRLNLESQFSKLDQKQVSEGRRFVNRTLKEMGQQQAREAILKFAPQGAKWIAKHIAKKAALPLAGAALRLALARKI